MNSSHFIHLPVYFVLLLVAYSHRAVVDATPTYFPSSSSNPSTSIVPSKSLSPSESNVPSVSTQPSDDSPTSNGPSREPSASFHDCTQNFCEKTLSNDYLLRYMLNVDDDTITMEVIYDDEAWVAVAFSEDGDMPGSDAVIGSPELGTIPQKYRLLAKTPAVDSAIEIMSAEEQTLINATVEVRDGQTIMKFTKLLKEEGQIEIKVGVNNMLWAYGTSNTLSYHAQRSPFTLDLSSDSVVNTAAPSFESSIAPSSLSNGPSREPSASFHDCTQNFCEKTLSNDYLLRYMLNVDDDTITMEVIYDDEAWVAVAFSEDGDMPGSDAVIGSPELGTIPQKYRLLAKTPAVDSAIEIMSAEEQTLINATVEVRDGQTIMKFTKLLKEEGQIEIKVGVNNMLWAYGTSNTLSYHAQRSPFTLDLSSDSVVNTAAPSFESSIAPSSLSTQIGCKQPWPDSAWLQPNFCSSLFVDGLSKPRGLHIDQTTDEILLVERGASRVVRLVPNIDDAKSTGTIVPMSQTEGLGLNHGIELAGGYLYASSTTNVYRWPYVDGAAGEAEEVIMGMQSGGHFTRTLAFDADGKWLYVSIGSLNNTDLDSSRSRIRRFDMTSWDGVTPFSFDDDGELFADGLRNEVGLAFDVHGDLWGVENGADKLERDDLGGDIHNDNPGEELNRFRDDQAGQSWGYPYCWSEYCLPQEDGGSGIKGANTVWAWPSFIDAGYTDQWCRENTNESVMSMPAHSAPLGMTFYKWKDLSLDESCEGGFPKSMNNYVFIAFHGSWNREPPTGYKVVFVPMDNDGNPTHQPIDLFRHAGDDAKWPDPGIRPVDVQFDSCGRLYVTEDQTGSVIQVRYGGSYLDNFVPIEKDVADGASCVASEQSSTSQPSRSESSNVPSSEPTPKRDELVRNLGDDMTNYSPHLVVWAWWPVHIVLLLFQILE